MKFVQLNDFGTPQNVCSLETEGDPGNPGVNEVRVRMLACPINPAELLILSGRYASKPPLPYRPGIEGVGEVSAIGEGVNNLAVGDRVISLGRNNWAEELIFKTNEVIRVPKDADPLQLGMLKVNPATAWLMLKRFVDLKPGDWLIQNAANSGVGHAVIQLAAIEGYKTINVVRRPWLVDQLKEQGADVVLIDDDDLAKKARVEIGDGKVRLAIDAVAGSATRRLADSLDDEGVVVNYGLLSGNPCEMSAEQLVFKGMTLTGFWLAKLLGGMDRSEVDEIYTQLGGYVADGRVKAPVDETYSLDEFDKALEHAAREGRNGKILLTPNTA